MKESHVLVVEDDPQMQRLLQSQLNARGYRVTVVAHGSDALASAADHEPAVVILDYRLPGQDGLQICRQLREWSQVPIIMLSAANTPAQKIQALDVGVDDYVTKPFHMGELVARIQAVTRRRSTVTENIPTTVELGDIVVDLPRRSVRRGQNPIHLTKIEFSLLRELAIHIEKVLTYEHLLREVWGPGYFDIRPIHVHMCNLRRKLQPTAESTRFIVAVPGVGYRLQNAV